MLSWQDMFAWWYAAHVLPLHLFEWLSYPTTQYGWVFLPF